MSRGVDGSDPEISIVVPVCNEEENIAPLTREVAQALEPDISYELIFVDDGSTDGTAKAVREAHASRCTRLLRHSRRSGQSAALLTGVRAARAEWIVTLDGDCQNDPADIRRLMQARDEALRSDPLVRLVMGHRVRRHDSWLRRVSSRVANAVRGRLLGDRVPDTGCGIKLMHRASFLELPAFDHMHRFLPALYLRQGAHVISVPVSHRPRMHGQSKYGVHNRLWVGIVDLFGMMWLRARHWPGLRVTEEPL